MSLSETAALVSSLQKELRRVIVGQDEVINEILTAFLAGGHCLLRGVPGLAKTLLIKTLAEAVHLKFSRIQFTPDLMPSDIIGTEVIEEDRATGSRSIRFMPGPIFANIILADEINRTPPKTQAALLEAMQEYQVTVGGVRHQLDRPLFVLATQNPIEQEGTYPLPEAQLDRFMLNVVIGYPSAADERTILAQTTTAHDPKVTPVATGEQIERARMLVRDVVAADNVIDYAARIVRSTRPAGPPSRPDAASARSRRSSPELARAEADGEGEIVPDFITQWVRWGAGPRAGQSLLLAGKARAVLHGRPAVSLEDVRAVAPPVLRHRILVNFQAEADGVDAEQVVARLLDAIPAR
ncbi:MAG TPA: MoxR family ATPase [Vicinamibacterales bacterium]|nr:MoxR family ATPase [Vicinamibacterales bacterium]